MHNERGEYFCAERETIFSSRHVNIFLCSSQNVKSTDPAIEKKNTQKEKRREEIVVVAAEVGRVKIVRL